MAKKDMDELKNRLKINEMNDRDRSELYKKFVEKGGKVVDEKNKSKNLILDKDKQKDYLRKIEERRKRLDAKYDAKSNEKYEKAQQNKKVKNEYQSIKTPLLILRIVGRFYGVTHLFSGLITRKTYEMIKNVLQDCFINLSYVGANLLNPKVIGPRRFKFGMMKRSPLSYEFIVRLSNLYNEDDFNTIIKFYEKETDGKVKPKDIKNKITNIFRKLFILYSNENRIIEAVTDGLEFNSKSQNLTKSFIEEILIRTKSSLKIIYSSKVFYKMFILYCLSSETLYRITNTTNILESLGLDINEIGTIAEQTKREINEYFKKSLGSKIKENIEGEGENKEDNEGNIEENDKEEDKENEISEDLILGKEIFDSLNFSIPDEDSTSKKRFFKPEDKMLYTSVAFDKFDKEFSFLLTTNKISYTVDYVQGKKFDLKNGLNKVYITFNTCKDQIDEYYKIIAEIHKIEKDTSVSITKKYNLMHNNQIRQNKISNDIRKKLLDGFKTLAELLQYSLENDLIVNSKEKLRFDRIDGKRFLENKTYEEAVNYALSFSKFMAYQLESGFLAGHNPMIKDEE